MAGVIRINSVENVTISDLTITNGNANYNGGGIYFNSSSSPSLVNCIIWNNSLQQVEFDDSYYPNTITIAYSDIDGGFGGIETNGNGTVNWLEGNIDADPIFWMQKREIIF